MPSTSSSEIEPRPVRALYLARVNRDHPGNLGVIRKCTDQVAAFRQLGFDMDLCWLCQDGLLLNEDRVASFPSFLLRRPLVKAFFFLLAYHPLLRRSIDFSRYSLFYIRYELGHPAFLRTLRHIRRVAPAGRIVLEIPSWPYDREAKGLLMRMAVRLDRRSTPALPPLVDLFTCYGSQVSDIFGRPALTLRNGIDPFRLPLRQPRPPAPPLRLLGIGNWQFWHGIDRLLHGIARFRARPDYRPVSLTLAGTGAALSEWKSLAHRLDIADLVRFLPPADGPDLDALFNEADLGIGTLAIHRKGLGLDSSLKHREYAARGLPFFLAGRDPDFPSSLPWVLRCPANDDPVEVDSLFGFHQACGQADCLAAEISWYARAHLTWEQQLRRMLLPALNLLLPRHPAGADRPDHRPSRAE
ncbi:MAG: hypothetical protein RLY31_2691 [Bacteroidota bacterium]